MYNDFPFFVYLLCDIEPLDLFNSCIIKALYYTLANKSRRSLQLDAKPAAWINKKRTFVYQKFSFCFGGSGWIRTTEVVDNRFTVCPLWPLGNTPPLLELVKGVEPPTC